MSDIELVVKIDEKLYKDIFSDAEIMIYSGMRSGKALLATLSRAIRNGKRLPKGHGKIVDLGKIDEDRIEKGNPVIELTVNGEYIEAVSLDYLNNLPAIVEADKEDLKYKGTGRWIEMPMEFMEDFDGSGVYVLKDPLECSECGCRSSKATEYCPHCGAKMTETIRRDEK